MGRIKLSADLVRAIKDQEQSALGTEEAKVNAYWKSEERIYEAMKTFINETRFKGIPLHKLTPDEWWVVYDYTKLRLSGQGVYIAPVPESLKGLGR